MRLYKLAHELGCSLEVLRRVTGVHGLPGAARLTVSDAETIRSRWRSADPAWVSEVRAVVNEEREAQRAEWEHEEHQRHLRTSPVLTAAEVEEFFRIRQATLRQWVRRGRLTPIDHTRRPQLFKREDVLEARRLASERRRRVVTSPRLVHDEDPGTIDRRLTTAEAAELVNVSMSTVRVWVHRGSLTPCGRKGRSLIFWRSDVLRAAASPKRR